MTESEECCVIKIETAVDCDHWGWHKGSIVGVWYHQHVIVPVHYLASCTFTAPYLCPCMPLFSLSITFSFLLDPPLSTSTPLLPWPAHLPWKVDHSCWAAAPKCVNQYPVPPNQHVRLGPSRAVSSSSDNQRFFPQCALFVIRRNRMLFKCLTDQEPISETELYLP